MTIVFEGSVTVARIRRTDADFENIIQNAGDSNQKYSYKIKIPLRDAATIAPSCPGVYILWLDNIAQKCGRVVYCGGLKWRFTQYYNLNYDSKAQKGDYSSITPQNRDDILVSWQTCPINKCRELESKLFSKYGKGPWAKRRPYCDKNTWELVI